jgi:hypothetical protein
MSASFTDLMEPAAIEGMSCDREDVPTIAALSIAISLKRIADSLTGACNEYGETMAESISGSISRGMNQIRTPISR